LEKIGAIVEQKWCSKEKSEVEEDKDNEEESEDSLGKSQEKRTPLSTSC